MNGYGTPVHTKVIGSSGSEKRQLLISDVRPMDVAIAKCNTDFCGGISKPATVTSTHISDASTDLLA